MQVLVTTQRRQRLSAYFEAPYPLSACFLQGRLAMDSKKTRSLQNSAMHLRKACNHPYLFLAGQAPPYEPADREELVRASGKLALLDNILPKLCATGEHSACSHERFTETHTGVTA